MGLFDSAARTYDDADGDADDTADAVPATAAATATATEERATTVTVAGEEIDLSDLETTQPDEDGTWLTGTQAYGRPRGRDAFELRQIAQTAPMQAIANSISQNLIGGELAFEDNDDVMGDLSDGELDAADRFREVLRDVLTGPHLQRESLDDLVVAAVEDMLGPGQAVFQFIPSADGSVPVAAMTTLDPLTVRFNVDKHGGFQEPAYWQAPGAGSFGESLSGMSSDPVPLQQDQVAILRYPFGNRSNEGPYGTSPAAQLKEWLELLTNSTTNHNRHYSDSKIPPGIISLIETATNNTVDDLKERIEAASGDPRDVPVVEGSAQWIDMGGTAVNLNIIEEQRWFFFLCLGALGLGKQDLGMVEDVNRSNGEVEASRVYKQVTGPFSKQFEEAFLKAARQFDTFTDLGEPFRPTLAFSDPREEHAREERLRQQYLDGVLSLREYHRRSPNQDLADDADAYTVVVNGQRVEYGDLPKWLAEQKVRAAIGDPDEDGQPDAGTPDGETESEGQPPRVGTNGHGGA